VNEDTIVHCKTLAVGDVIRPPVPGGRWREVTAVDHASKTVTTEGDGPWRYGRGYVWVVKQA